MDEHRATAYTNHDPVDQICDAIFTRLADRLGSNCLLSQWTRWMRKAVLVRHWERAVRNLVSGVLTALRLLDQALKYESWQRAIYNMQIADN